MKRFLPCAALAVSVGAPWVALAQSSDIYMCVDDQGNKSFQNVGTAKGCKRMDVGPVLSLPASRMPASRAAGRRRRRSGFQPRRRLFRKSTAIRSARATATAVASWTTS